MHLLTRKNLVKNSAIALGVLASTVVTSASITAYRAVFGARVQINVASELKIFKAKFSLEQNFVQNISDPDVEAVRVRAPRIFKATLEQSFTIPEEVVSAIQKEIDISAPEKITFSETEIDLGEEPLEQHQLTAVLMTDDAEEYQVAQADEIEVITPKKSIHRKAHRKIARKTAHKMNTQIAVEPSAIQKLAEMSEASEVKVTPMVAWNDVQGVDRLGYSDLVNTFLNNQPYNDAAEAIQVNPKHIDDKTPIKFPNLKSAGGARETDASINGDTRQDTSEPVRVVNSQREETMPVEMNTQEASSQSAAASQSNAGQPIDVKQFMKAQDKLDTQAAAQGGTGPLQTISYNNGTVGASTVAVSKTPLLTPAKDEPARQGAPISVPVLPTPPSPKPDDTQNLNATDEGGEESNAKKKTQSIQNFIPPVPEVDYFSGRVVEAFSGAQQTLAQVEVQILGTQWTAVTDHDGKFTFKNVPIKGVLPVVLSKSGYLKRRLDMKRNSANEAELVSENSAALSAVAADDRYTSGSAFVFGQLASVENEAIELMKVSVAGPRAIEAIYMNDKGLPDRSLTMTSSRGQFLLLNMQPGSYVVTITDAFGHDRAPHLIHVGASEGLVRKFSMGEKRIIRGRVMNATAINAVVEQAQIQILGTTQTANTDSQGRYMIGPVYIDCAEQNYLQVDKDGYYRNRLDYVCASEKTETAVFVFTKSYVEGLSADAQNPLKANTGVVVGHVGIASSVKAQLWGPEELEPTAEPRGRDYYLRKDGVLDPHRTRTSKTGNFTILDAPDGMSYIQTFGKDDKTLSYWPVYISPSTVNVFIY